VTNSLATRRPQVAREWHPTRNGGRTPDDFVWSSNEQVWWKCAHGDDHEWRARINNRTSNDTGCPVCAGATPGADTCLAAVFPKLAAEWHSLRNGSLTPAQVTAQSNRIAWWRCRLGHEWKASVQNRARGAGCPFCSDNRASRRRRSGG
jgi:hypothetical protein